MTDDLPKGSARAGLRLVFSAFAEGLLPPDAWVSLTVDGFEGARQTLEDATDALRALYTVDPARLRGGRLHMAGTAADLADPVALARTAILPAAEATLGDLTHAQKDAFLEEMTDGGRNEALADAARATFHHALRNRLAPVRNLFEALRDPRLARERDDIALRLGSFSGHRTHPTAKTRLRRNPETGRRQGLSSEKIRACAPEFGPAVALPLLAVDATRVTIALSRRIAPGTDPATRLRAYLDHGFPDAMAAWRRAIGRDWQRFVPLSVHPLQMPVIERHFAQPLADGAIRILPGVCMVQRPTLSFRTLTALPGRGEPSVKTTLDIQMTSVVRTLAPARAFNAPVYTDLLQDILEADADLARVLRIVPEPAALYWGRDPDPDGPDYRDGYQLAAVFKDDPATARRPADITLPLNTLFAVSPLSGRRVMLDVMAAARVADGAGALDYFVTYADLVLRADLGMLVGHGVSLESHQQNVEMAFDGRARPTALVYRDINGGLEIHEPTLRATGRAVRETLHPVLKGLHESADLPLRQTVHTTLASHLLPMVHVIADGYALGEEKLRAGLRLSIERTLARVVATTRGCRIREAMAARARHALIDAPMETKCLLTMRLRQSQETTFTRQRSPFADIAETPGTTSPT